MSINGWKDRSKAQAFYDKLTKKQEFFHNARRLFYCTLCSADALEQNSDYELLDWLIADHINYNSNFCSMIVSYTHELVDMI